MLPSQEVYTRQVKSALIEITSRVMQMPVKYPESNDSKLELDFDLAELETMFD